MTDSSSTQTAPLPQLNGVLVLNKHAGPTSARCISALKRLGQRKIGHAGTLDPMASGVLLVLLGQATKLSNYLLGGGRKIYRGVLTLGRETDTWDAEGTVTAEAGWEGITDEAVRREIAAWAGKLEQEVPPYSAAKHQGQPLYKLARTGKEVPVKIKSVEIFSAEILSLNLPAVEFRVECSSGTYIRSLAHSLGMRLGCGATLTELTREYSHPFGLAASVTLDEIKADPAVLTEHVHPLAEALPGWPVIGVDRLTAERMRNGMPIQCPTDRVTEVANNNGLALVQDAGEDLAITQLRRDGSLPVLAVARGLWN